MVSRANLDSRDEGNLIMVPIRYVCRVCATKRPIYVCPVERDDELIVDLDSRHRVTVYACPDCGYERPHVAADTLSGTGGDDRGE